MIKLKIKGDVFILIENDIAFELTSEKNFNAFIQDANDFTFFYKSNGFITLFEVIEYMQKYFDKNLIIL